MIFKKPVVIEEMTQTWLVFQIGNQNVYQIRYNICTGQDTIDDYKEILAREYKVSELDVLVKFNDEVVIAQKIVSSELELKTREALDTIEIKN